MRCPNCLEQIDLRDEHVACLLKQNDGKGNVRTLYYCERRITDMQILEAQAKVRRAFMGAWDLYKYSLYNSPSYATKEGRRTIDEALEGKKRELLTLLEDGLQSLTGEVKK